MIIIMQMTDAQFHSLMEVYRNSCGNPYSVRHYLESIQIAEPTEQEILMAYKATDGYIVGTMYTRDLLSNFVHFRNNSSKPPAESNSAYEKVMMALHGATLTPVEAERIGMNAKLAVKSDPRREAIEDRLRAHYPEYAVEAIAGEILKALDEVRL